MKIPFDQLMYLFANNKSAEIDRYFSCESKTTYYSPLTATRQAYHLETTRVNEFFEVYQCRWCDFYHFGHVKDRSRFSYKYKGATQHAHPADKFRQR